jgi:hypothetical protein
VDVDTTRGKPLPSQIKAFPVDLVLMDACYDPFFDHDSARKIGIGRYDPGVR